MMEYIVTLIVALLAFIGGMSLNRAQAENTNVKTIGELSKQISELVKERAADRISINDLERALDAYKDEVKQYFEKLMDYFDEKGLTDYPKPPKSLFDTKDRRKAVR